MSFCKFEEETIFLLTLYLSIESQMEKVLNERKKELKEEQKKEMEKMKKEHESNMKKKKQEMEDQVRTGDIKQRRRNWNINDNTEFLYWPLARASHAATDAGQLGLRVWTTRRLKCPLHCITHSILCKELYMKTHTEIAHQDGAFKIFLMMTSGEMGQ